MGIVPVGPTVYENLEDLALTVRHQLGDQVLPSTSFNGGRDVWCDIGSKSIGLAALMKYIGASPEQVRASQCLVAASLVAPNTCPVADIITTRADSARR